MATETNHLGAAAAPEGTEAQRHRGPTRRPRGRIMLLIEAGYSAPAIAHHLGVTPQAVYNAARRAGRRVARCAAHVTMRSGVAVTRKGRDAMRAYERAHGLPAAIGGA